MWSWVKRQARKVANGVRGFVSGSWHALRWLGLRLVPGILELAISYIGWMPTKRLRVQVLIFKDSNGKPFVSEQAVDAVVETAKRVFREEAHIQLFRPMPGDEIVEVLDEVPPDWVRRPFCDADGYKQVFKRAGRWFREHTAKTSTGVVIGFGQPATIFVLDDVVGKAGCFLGVATDYGYIDPTALSGSTGMLLTLAHELAHACDLRHRKNASNLMSPDASPRTQHLTRWQRSVARSSPRVTYW